MATSTQDLINDCGQTAETALHELADALEEHRGDEDSLLEIAEGLENIRSLARSLAFRAREMVEQIRRDEALTLILEPRR